MALSAFWYHRNFKDLLIEGGGAPSHHTIWIDTATYSESHGNVVPPGVLPSPFNSTEYDNCKQFRSYLRREINADIILSPYTETVSSSILNIDGGQKRHRWTINFMEPGYYRFRHVAKFRTTGAIYDPDGATSFILAFIKSRIIAKVDGVTHTSGSYAPVIGDWIELDFSTSRGDEVLNNISVFKIISGGGLLAYVSAVLGIDYELELISPKKWRIKFLDDLNFEVRYNIKGYNSNEHPYRPVSSLESRFYSDDRKILVNESSLRLNFNTREPVINITYPQISPDFSSAEFELIISEDPFNIYTSNFLIKPTILYSTGIFVEEGETMTISPEDWRDMMIADLNLQLEIFKEDGTLYQVVLDANWDIGNYVDMLEPGKYKVKYKNTLR